MAEIVELNIGGTIYLTIKSTLLSEPDNLFNSLLNDEIKQKDSNNRLFIDRDGALFGYILDYLRNREDFVKPENQQDLNRLKKEAFYYKITSLVKILESENNSQVKIDIPLCHNQQNQNKKLFGCIVLGYRGTFINGRETFSDIRFRKITRILISGQVKLCREVFGEALNESRDPDHGLINKYSSRYFLKHSSLEQAIDTLMEASFQLKAATGTSAMGMVELKEMKKGNDFDEGRWRFYNEYVFVRYE